MMNLIVKLSNAIFIDRKNHKKAIESTTQAVADMKKHNVGLLGGALLFVHSNGLSPSMQ